MRNKEIREKQPRLRIKKFLNLFSLFFIFYFLFFNLAPAQAQDINNLMINLVAPTPLIRAELIKVIFSAIQYLLGFLGVVAVLILIYGGFLWMTARGDEERVRKAKKVLINGLIGLIVILLSYAIVMFVVGPLLRAYLAGEEGFVPIEGGPGDFPRGANYLVITSRYPKPEEITPQNIKVVITFNQGLDSTSVKLARPDAPTTCKDPNLREIWTVGIKNNVTDEFVDGSVKIRGNALIFIPKNDCPPPFEGIPCTERDCIPPDPDCCLNLTPDNCCGCFDPANYTITLKAERRIAGQIIRGLEGTRTGRNKLYKDEIWSFDVANYLDTRAPEVENNLPKGENVARNVGILVTFTKDIDLTTLTLYNPACVLGSANCIKDNCGVDACLDYAVGNPDEASAKIYQVDDQGNKIGEIPGFFERFSTKAFLFRPSTRCDPPNNQCRCLPPLTRIKVELVSEGEIAIRDVNCNSLDCPNCPGPNCKCNWTFKTSREVDITPPEVETTEPKNNQEGVDRLLEIKADFSEDMDPTSVNEDTFVLRPETPPRSIETDNDLSTFIPFKILEPDTNYSPIIYGTWERRSGCELDPDSNFGVKDLAGNAMFGNRIWRFKTAWIVADGRPYIYRVIPSQGPRGECVTVLGYNLGCCSPYECQEDKEAQTKNWDFQNKVCSSYPSIGQASMLGLEDPGPPPVYDYFPATVLLWQEIYKPESCDPNIPPGCPTNCTIATCPLYQPGPPPSGCLECKFCSDPVPANCGTCWCPMPPRYSPENELVIVVPKEATNRSPSEPGQIKVVPAQ